jgi:hypothetical protein
VVVGIHDGRSPCFSSALLARMAMHWIARVQKLGTSDGRRTSDEQELFLPSNSGRSNIYGFPGKTSQGLSCPDCLQSSGLRNMVRRWDRSREFAPEGVFDGTTRRSGAAGASAVATVMVADRIALVHFRFHLGCIAPPIVDQGVQSVFLHSVVSGFHPAIRGIA